MNSEARDKNAPAKRAPRRSGGAIEEAARTAAAEWAARFRASLLHERRVPAGGWPGTLTEARAVAATCLRAAATRGAGNDQRAVDHEQLARLINACARCEWLRTAVRETPERLTEETE